jgi:hypothetical protein
LVGFIPSFCGSSRFDGSITTTHYNAGMTNLRSARTDNLSTSIPLDERLHPLNSGPASTNEIAQEQAAARAAMIAGEEDYLRRRRQLAELIQPLMGRVEH